MADAPAGGGGGISGVEIILILVLVIGAIATLSGHPLTNVGSTSSTKTTVSTTTSRCGITLSRPVKNEKAAQTVTVIGTIMPCTSDAPIKAAVTAQVVDSTGVPLSDYTHITMSSATATTASFATTIPLTGTPAAGTGYVILTGPANLATGISMTARVAIKFQ
jgi:hypothetical protein